MSGDDNPVWATDGFELYRRPDWDGQILRAKKDKMKKARKAYGSLYRRSGAYIFLETDTRKAVYAGQTRYYDRRAHSNARMKGYDELYLITGIRRILDEAWLQELEHLLIDHFKGCAWGTDFIPINSKSESPSLMGDSRRALVGSWFEKVRDILEDDCDFPLHTRTNKTSPKTEFIYSKSKDTATKKFYHAKVEVDAAKKIMCVLKGSKTPLERHSAHAIHQRLKEGLENDGTLRGSTMNGKACFEFTKDWICMNLSEATGVVSNGPGPIEWLYQESDKPVEKDTLKKWRGAKT